MANLKDTIVLGNLTVTGKINGAIDNSGGSGVSVINANPTLAWSTQSTVATIGGTAITLKMPTNPADYPTGFNSRKSSWTWGTLTTANSYTQLTNWATTNGSEIAFAEKSGAVSVQIDGFFYQNEGRNKVLDTSNISGTANAIAKFTAANTIGNSNISDDNTTITLGKSVAVRCSKSSYNEGIRITPSSTGGWSNIFFSDTVTDEGTHEKGWLCGKMNTGNFTIEPNGSSGSGLWLPYTKSNRPKWNNNELAYLSDVPNTQSGRFVKCSASDTGWSDGPADLGGTWYKENSFMGSASTTDFGWQNIINIRHRGGGGEGDNSSYGLQIRSSLVSDDRLYYRHQANGNWASWVSVANLSDIKNPTDYYWANVQISAISNSTTTPTFSSITCSGTNPISMTGAGDGTYNRAVLYCNSDGITLETNRATDADDGTALPFMVKTRGGQYADIKSYNSHVTNLYSTVNTNLWLTGTAEGWKLPGNDTYGCIYPATTNYGQIGISSNRFWKGYINNLYSSNTYTSTCTYTNKITANTSTTGTAQYTGKISLTPSTYGWKLSAETNVAAPYGHAFYPETNNKGAIGIDYYHFSQGWINYLYTCILYPTDTSSVAYKANVGKVGTSTYYFAEGSFYKVYRSTEASLSDIRLKQNVNNSKLSALNIVNQLDIIDFQYLEDFKQDEILKKKKLKAAAAMKSLEKTKDNRQLRKRLQEIISTPNNSKMRTIGISAQQLESLLPPEYLKTFISKEATEKYSDQYFIKENRLIYLVMKAVQEQQAIIDEQQNKITSLEERMAHLESLLLGDK
jgi:hypothetical protein